MEHLTDLTDINVRVDRTIGDLLSSGIDGCIAGSCVLPEDFNTWATDPDVDIFAYTDTSWVYTTANLLANSRYEPASGKDAWKLSRIKQGRMSIKTKFTQTIYIKDTLTNIYINISHKPGADNIVDVLSRFDTVAIMLGICCRTKVKVDLRQSFFSLSHQFTENKTGDANPIRLWYMAEHWDEETWSRQLARIKKYQSRGYDMNQMAWSMIQVAVRVLAKGDAVDSERSRARYLNLMLSCYRPVIWLEEFIGEVDHNSSSAIFAEITKLIKSLPIETQDKILSDLSDPLIPCADKIFKEEEGEDEAKTEQDR